MNAEHQALAEYLEDRFNNRFDQVDQRLNGIDQEIDGVKQELNNVNREIGDVNLKLSVVNRELGNINTTLYNQIHHVDIKNDSQDEQIDDHELRISALESDYRILTS